MPIPKIVLIDGDAMFAFMLQAKLGEYFLNDIKLEVITDQSYFNEYFSEHQTIDLLIIDERFYFESIKKHNVNKILVLTENEDSSHRATGNVIQIYKYSNIREIINVIISRNVGIINNGHKQNGTQVILVTSAAGGVGKTTIALGLGMALERDYKKVLYIDAESFQTFPHIVNNMPTLDGNEMVELVEKDEIFEHLSSHIVDKGFSYLPAFRNPILSVGLTFEIYTLFIEAVKKSEEYDYIVVDSDSAFNKEKVDLMACADKVIFVTDQSDKGIYSTNQMLKNISEVDEGKYLFISNKYIQSEKNQKNDVLSNYIISEFVELYPDGEVTLEALSLLRGLQRIAFLIQ